MSTKPKKPIQQQRQSGYISLKDNGRLFPSWIPKNFKKYRLDEIEIKDGVDPCNLIGQTEMKLRKYQAFIGEYLGPHSPYNEILLYHNVGSGKTSTCINLINVLYNFNHNYNFIILIKAALRDDPWMKDLKIWLGRDPGEESVESVTKLNRYNSIHFVHYDSPYADRDFLNTMKAIDTSKPIVYFIDEAHNFIRNVYSNLNSKEGKRAQIIYEYILRDKRENKNTKVILVSATPGINTPFELALMFNLLRPGIFPNSESEFNRIFVTESAYPILNPQKRNMFERRIMGLVSYYIGATPDLYAKQELKYVNLPMSDYQYEIYRVFEKLEEEIQNRARKYGKQSQLYRTYTRQACNFVFPYVNMNLTGELRPRPGKFNLHEKQTDALEKGKKDAPVKGEDKEYKERVKQYVKALEIYLVETEKYFQDISKSDKKEGRTITDDLNDFKEGFSTKYKSKFLKFYKTDEPRSKLFEEMYKCSPKMTAIVFYSYVSPGKVMVYSNYVLMEGIDMLKVYFRLAGFNDYTVASENMGYCEYHGRIDAKDRVRIKNMYNDKSNLYGAKCKVFLLSPSATEGIQLYDIRQEHILEPYWTEVRIQQVVGRGIRQCSHKNLPMSERNVTIYRYKVVKPKKLDPDDKVRITTDEHIEDQAKAKANLIESFLSAMKEVAVDCVLFAPHNMMTQSYQCFQFPESAIMGKYVGPAYKEDIRDDLKYDSGLGAKNSKVERIKVIMIRAVRILGTDANGVPEYSAADKYWYNPKTGIVYDYETHYSVGKVEFIGDMPNKLDKDTYIMSIVVNIPSINDSPNL